LTLETTAGANITAAARAALAASARGAALGVGKLSEHRRSQYGQTGMAAGSA